ncbi:MAG: hypothetical protein LUI13_13925 [Lachnospiraceae bacterium]|nr:hypothetical protein [Lachnospiraceae bacterium]
MFETVIQVTRKRKLFTKTLRVLMLAFGILFILMAIIFTTGLMLPGACMILLYYVYGLLSRKEYEYHFSGSELSIFVISGGQIRRQAQELDLGGMEVVAPNWHEAVSNYKKKYGSVKLKKYDYTSYDDAIPYYTMIIMDAPPGQGAAELAEDRKIAERSGGAGKSKNKKKIKLLLDLDEETLRKLKNIYPDRVYI